MIEHLRYNYPYCIITHLCETVGVANLTAIGIEMFFRQCCLSQKSHSDQPPQWKDRLEANAEREDPPLNVQEEQICLSTPHPFPPLSLSWVFPPHGAHLLFKAAGRNAFKLTGAESPDIC